MRTETQLSLLHLYSSKNAKIFDSLDISNQNTHFQTKMAQSVEHATADPTVPGWSLGHSLLFGQYLGTYVSCERIGKNEDCVITLACARHESYGRQDWWGKECRTDQSRTALSFENLSNKNDTVIGAMHIKHCTYRVWPQPFFH